MRRTRSLTPLLLLAVLAAGCGSTALNTAGVGLPAQQGAGADGLGTDGFGGAGLGGDGQGAAGQGLDAAAPDGTSPGLALDGQAGSFGGSSGSPGSASAGSASGSGAAGSGPGRAPAGAAAPATGDGLGVSKGAVNVGLTYTVNADAAQESLGSSFQVGDTKSYLDALVAHVNRTGGVKGRKLQPVFYEDDATSGDTQDSRDQARCAFYTQDNEVFAVLDSSARENFLSCIGKRSMNIGGFEVAGYNEADFVRHPYFFNVNTLTGEKQYRGLVASLVRQKWFTGWDTDAGAPGTGKAVVGVLSVDFPQITVVTDKILLPGLARAGHQVDPDNVVRLRNPRSSAETGQVVSEIQNAVLRFRANGVTHVIIMDNAGGVTFFFSQGAEGQRYRPRYGVTTANALQGLVESGQMAVEQARGALGLGYVPLSDLPDKDNPADRGPYTNATRKGCLKIYSDAGIAFGDSNSEQVALGFCDKVLFFRLAASKVDGPLNRDTFRASVESLGDSFVASPLQVSRFGPDRHYGIVRGYDMRFDDRCSCVRYGAGFSLD